jgi:hypothetical protein
MSAHYARNQMSCLIVTAIFLLDVSARMSACYTTVEGTSALFFQAARINTLGEILNASVSVRLGHGIEAVTYVPRGTAVTTACGNKSGHSSEEVGKTCVSGRESSYKMNSLAYRVFVNTKPSTEVHARRCRPTCSRPTPCHVQTLLRCTTAPISAFRCLAPHEPFYYVLCLGAYGRSEELELADYEVGHAWQEPIGSPYSVFIMISATKSPAV